MDSPICDVQLTSFKITLDHNHIEDTNNLRNSIANDRLTPRPDFPLGGVVLDVAERDLTGIVTRVVDHMIASHQIPADQRDQVITILLRKRTLSLVNDSIFSRNNSADDLNSGVSTSSASRYNITGESATYIRYASSTEEIEIDDIKNNDAAHEELTVVMAGSLNFLASPILVFVRLSERTLLQDFIEVSVPVKFIFVLLGSFQDEKDYHEISRSIFTLMANKAFLETAYTANSLGQLISAANYVLPRATCTHDITSESISSGSAQREQGSSTGSDGVNKKRNPLIRAGKPFYGFYLDIKERYPMYLSDIVDGFNIQVLAATIFIFFAFLSTAITFGGMYGDFTHDYIGVGECLLLSSVNGAIVAMFAAQPILMVGSTGPLMVFDKSLYQFTQKYELDFLSMRVWIGMWMLVIGIIFTAFEAAVIMRKFTRFMEEIFASLICLIFVYEAITKMVAIFHVHPLLEVYSCGNDTLHANFRPDEEFNDTDVWLNTTGRDVPTPARVSPQPNTALLSLILMVGTFTIATQLKKFRNSKFFGRSVRRALGDFGVPIAIILMVLLDFLIKDTFTDKLTMPEGLQPSSPDIRGWIINPLGQVKPLPVWCMLAAAPAALLIFFLVFLEGSICHLILSKPERKMVKGTGFHLDLVLSCFINLMSGLFGAPFMGPACIRTVAHVAALTVTSPARSPGQPLQVEGVREQRLSGLAVAILVGLAVLFPDVVNLVPKAVLLGVFLYMGIAATAGIHFLERLVLIFMPVKYHPDTPFVKKVRTVKMHMFTIVQLIMLGVLWSVKESSVALALPFVLSLLVPLRLYFLPIIFSKSELNALDGSEAMENDNTDEPDFYEALHALPSHASLNLPHL